MRGDPSPTCLVCAEYLGGPHIQVPDGRLICIPCYAPTKQRDGLTWTEVDEAIRSIRRAGSGQV